MRVVLQRVEHAAASDLHTGAHVGRIGVGVVLYVGFGRGDELAVTTRMAHKIANLRIFEEGESTFGRSLVDVGGEALVLSQFTVMADTTRGRRPNFSHAAAPESARELYAAFAEALGQQVPTVAGPFASRLMVDARNRGPFTLPLEL